MKISKEYCGIEHQEEGIVRKPLLKGEIDGVDTFYIELPKGRYFRFTPMQNPVSIFLVTKGHGIIWQGNKQFKTNEVVLFVPSVVDGNVSITAEKKSIGILEIMMQFSKNDLNELKNWQSKFPYFVAYSQCRKYKESIKSEKTVNRMLLPENIVPRLCIGSVETNGPDKVGEHSHPMLEQLFFGLEKNNCIVTADGIEVSFEEETLLHIPLGSEHGVKVEKGKTLNYIWMDFFCSTEDMGYMSENHIIEDE